VRCLDDGVGIAQRRQQMTGATKLFQGAVSAEAVAHELQDCPHFLNALPRLVNRFVLTIGQTVCSRPQLFLDDAVETFTDGLIVSKSECHG
jgi:hypothetical protein